MSQKRLVEIVLQGKDESKGAFDSLANSLGLADAGALKFAAGAAAVGAAVVAAGSKLYNFTADMAEAGDEIEKLAARTGVAVEQLSEFEFALERGGGSSADLEPAIRRLSRAMSDARDNIKEAKDAFERLGISTSMLVDGSGNLRDVSEIMPLVADGLRGISSQADRMDIAQAIFGRGGTMLLPMLQQGADGIREMREEMERYGGAMSEEFAAKSAEFVDSQTNLANATQRLKEALSEPFLAPFTAAVNALAKAIADAHGFIHRPPIKLDQDEPPEVWGQEDWHYNSVEPPSAQSPASPNAAAMPTEWGGSGWFGTGANWWDRQEMTGDIELFDPEDMTGSLDMVTDGLDEASATWKSQMEGMGSVAESVSATLSSSMSAAFASIITGSQSAADAMESAFASAVASIANMLISLGISAIFDSIAPGSGAVAGGIASGSGATNVAGKSYVGPATKGAPSLVNMGQGGAMVADMMATHSKVYV